MRILHTSDWHLGRTTYGEPRSADHDAVLDEITSIARSECPDVIINTGDLFDHARPAHPDIHKALDVLGELASIAPVVVVCGNHDSPSLFGALEHPHFRNERVRFVSKPLRPEDGGILRFPGRDGTTLRLACLPFINAHRIVEAFEDAAGRRSSYSERVGHIERTLAATLLDGLDPRHEVAMFAAHFHVAGANLAHSERPVHTSDYYATSAEDLPEVSYAAFGHIHKPQALPSTRVTGRYAGSPLQLDFGEEGEDKSVVVVDARPGNPAHVETIGLTAGRRLRRLEGTLDQLRAAATDVRDELCMVTVHTKTHQPDLSERVRTLLPDATVVQVNEVCAERRLEVVRPQTAHAGGEPTIDQMFHNYLTDHGTHRAPAGRVAEIFTHLWESIDEEHPSPLDEELALTQHTGRATAVSATVGQVSA